MAEPYRAHTYRPGGGMRKFGNGEKVKPASIWHMLSRIFEHARVQWKLLIVAILCIIAISLLEFTIPQLTRYTIDVLIPGKHYNQLAGLGAGIMGAALLLGILNYLSASTTASLGQRVIYDLRNDLYRHINRLDLGFFDRNRTGDLMSRVTSDVGVLQQLISSTMIQLVTDLFTFSAITVYMLFLDWRLTVLLLATFPLMVMTTRLFGKRMRSSFRTVQESVAEVSDHLQNTLSGIRLIKSFATESLESERFARHSKRNMEANIRVTKLRAMYEPVIDLLNYLGLAIVLVFGAWLTMKGYLSVGTVVAVIAYLRLLQNPIRRFSRIINTIQQSAAAYERISEIMNTKPEIIDAPDAISLPRIQGQVEFHDVSFRYSGSGDKAVLERFNLTLEAGKVTALVGSSGSGKTTIAHLIARFYEPQAGEITIDGYPLRQVSLASLRERLGIVSQDIILFNGSVRDNISYGKQDATEAELMAAARAANAHDFIEAFPDGYDTAIGERGVKLSGGQKQRISIARVILKNPELIILDEATASLDTESEHLIQEALGKLLRGRTCLVIAHRLSTIQQADNIHVLEHGSIVESGTHEQLLRLDGRYRELYELQFPQAEGE
ncbi:ABC transporter ATP-binding protein [Paenibacillus sp. MMS18-CY102]|uniref:ABC transporter ATP-binding protein n=1 Tax=Paenibacillus sp. MMS18-CY102 TaxID=2682849 RepID=UPI0013654D93|nr:ABC transporter ATP-binding protein [Paenibacillus sp. MMS18-CY102]MWC30457.1 ATP-binding cassette domain-containing protein [Paenibacillus sp. MMS18-CY102]